MRTISCWGMPSVIQTTSGISASIASSILAAASGGLPSYKHYAVALGDVGFSRNKKC